MAIAAILLAAEDLVIDGTPIALLPWQDDTTLIEYQIEQLQDAGVDAIEVVLGFDAETLIPLVAHNNVEPVINNNWRDPNASLRVGAAAVPRDTEYALIARVDEPRRAHIYRTLLDAHDGVGQITQPTFDHGPGSPIVAGYDALAAIRNSTRDGLDGLLASWPHVASVPFDSDVVLLTIRSHEDYERARTTLTRAR
jgi:CTP:molybdopterin cytidylyltransferase MocA